jgi:hypothetical protein
MQGGGHQCGSSSSTSSSGGGSGGVSAGVDMDGMVWSTQKA